MGINLNDTVSVRLRNSGADRLNRESIAMKNKYPDVRVFQDPRIYSAGDVYQCQLWDLMRTFGDMLLKGFELPFDTNIEVSQ